MTDAHPQSLAVLTNATRMLAEVKTLDDARHLMGIAASAKVYAQKHKLGREAVGLAHEIEISAEIILGEILREMEKNEGGRPTKKTAGTGPVVSAPTLKEIGVSEDLSRESQALAGLSERERSGKNTGPYHWRSP